MTSPKWNLNNSVHDTVAFQPRSCRQTKKNISRLYIMEKKHVKIEVCDNFDRSEVEVIQSTDTHKKRDRQYYRGI